jgi:hypothetical protein
VQQPPPKKAGGYESPPGYGPPGHIPPAYFPFLHARQFELLAVVRASGALVTNGKILPVFEPVKVNTAPILRRATAFGAAGLTVALFVNPIVGELYGNPQSTAQLIVRCAPLARASCRVARSRPGVSRRRSSVPGARAAGIVDLRSSRRSFADHRDRASDPSCGYRAIVNARSGAS